VFDRDRVILVPDHFTPNKDILSATQCKVLRDFVKQQDLSHSFEGAPSGSNTCSFPSRGWCCPGIWSSALTVIPVRMGHWGLCHRGRQYGSGVGHADGSGLVQGARVDEDRPSWKPSQVGLGKGSDPVPDRPDRCGRGAQQGHGVHRRDGRPPRDGGSFHDGQHGHRGRGQKRDLRPGRNHGGLRPAEGETQMEILRFRPRCALRKHPGDRRERDRAPGCFSPSSLEHKGIRSVGDVRSIRSSSVPAPTGASRTCALPPVSSRDGRLLPQFA